MKKVGLVIGIILSGVLTGCDLFGDIEELFDEIDKAAESALGGANYVEPYGDGSTSQNFPFNIDSATFIGNNGLTLWTSYIYNEYSGDTSREFNVRYRDLSNENSIKKQLSIKDGILTDTVFKYPGVKYFVFPLEIKDLQPQTEYLFCVDLLLFNIDYQVTFTSPCKTFQTSF